MLIFLDAYKGYHQIWMYEADKTAFLTEMGVYCYQKMPFGFQNAGATYQRLVNRVFANQIGRNMEVYVDDMVVKCRKARDAPIEETLRTLRAVNMKINPSTFGVGSGKFLGYMVSKRGRKANPRRLGPSWICNHQGTSQRCKNSPDVLLPCTVSCPGLLTVSCLSFKY